MVDHLNRVAALLAFIPIDFQPFHVANLCDMKHLISNDFQKVPDSPRDWTRHGRAIFGLQNCAF